MRCTLRELECRDVISLCDGRFLGHISDLEIDTECGRILSVTVSQTGGFWSSGREEICIPWQDIRCIGEDAVLVEFRGVCPEQNCRTERRNRKWHF